MNTLENTALFADLNAEEAVSVNGGDALSDYIASIGAAVGVPPEYYNLADQFVGAGLWDAFAQGGTLGQTNYLLGLVYNTDWFAGLR